MKTLLTFFALLFTIIACQGPSSEKYDFPKLSAENPEVVTLNTHEGYSINLFSGKKIDPLINSFGNKVVTGRAVPISLKKVSNDSILAPERVVVSKPSELNSSTNRQPARTPSRVIFEASTVSPLGSIKRLINQKGDTVPTGVPIKVVGNKTSISVTRSTQSAPPGVTNNSATNIHQIDTDQGMTSSKITSILQDSKGNFWFGTEGSGVSKYNGNRFAHYTDNSGLNNNFVYSILEDRKGNIWFGTYDGLNRFDGKNFTHFTEKQKLAVKYINSIIEDRKGNIWFGTDENGICKFDGKYFTYYTVNEGLSSNKVTAILEDRKGTIWIGTKSDGLNKFDGKRFTQYLTNGPKRVSEVTSLCEDKSGALWIGTADAGVFKQNENEFSNYSKSDGLCGNAIHKVVQDEKGNMWFASSGNGVTKFDGFFFTNYSDQDGLSSNFISAMIEDQRGNMWFGTHARGINKLCDDGITQFRGKDGLSSPTVKAILQDKKGNIWFGTYGGGACKYDGESFWKYGEKQGLSNSNVTSILEDHHGNIWLGTYGSGVYVYDGESFTVYNEESGLSGNVILSMIEDRSHTIWLGTDGGGLTKFDGRNFSHLTEKEGLGDNCVLSICEDRKGNLWFGTYEGGVSKLTGNTLTSYSEKEGLSSNLIMSIVEDSQGIIWLGTEGGGVNKFDGSSITYFGTKEGLSSNTIRSMVVDDQNNLWVGTQNGVSQISLTGRASVAIKTFNKLDGIKSFDFMPGSATVDDKNRVWFGSMHGATMIDLKAMALTPNPPKLQLNTIEIDEQFIDYRSLKNSTQNKIHYTEVKPYCNFPTTLSVSFDKNHLTFFFTAIDWHAPHKVRYSYKMKGLQQEWSELSSEGKADYRSLPYGEYVFVVRAIGESQSWSEPMTYSFKVLPPWWHTWWARSLYVIVLLIGFFSYVRWRTYKLKMRQKELEVEIENATVEIRDQKNEIEKEKDRSEELLLNILPEEIAEELKDKGYADAQLIDMVTVLFTDFKGFTSLSEVLSPQRLIEEINVCFSEFDRIMEKYNIEKIKTIGDAYMAAGGLPTVNKTHSLDVLHAALEIRDFMILLAENKKANHEPFFEIRIGVHTGPVIAGIVGVKKFQYDIWGDTVNTASRMESSGGVGKVNISESTYELVKGEKEFSFEPRGKIEAKGKGFLEMYFVEKASQK